MEISDKGSLTWTVTPDLLGILDRSGRFTDTNPAWFKTLGLMPTDIEVKIFFEFIHPDDLAATEQAFKDIQTGMNILGFENRYRHIDGDYRWLSWNCVPVGDLFFCSARDITAQKSTEEALRTSVDVAALREQFVAVLGHDLRNPLAAISSGMNILKRKYDKEETRDLMKAMDTSVQRMAGLIDDVMDFARARLGGGISVQGIKEVVLTKTLEQTVQELRAAHPDRRIIEDFEFAEPVKCQSNRIAQMLSNLLANAITHGDPAIPIRVRAFDHEHHFNLSVENSGAAIPSAARKMMFQPFARSNVATSQNGLGLGLFIASEIAKAHGGTLAFTSDDNKTVFVASIPKT